MRLDTETALERLLSADHAVLATTGPHGPDIVPVCFAVHTTHVGIPVDRVKPKSSTRLQRVRNLEVDPRATLLCEAWDPQDWSRLWWVRARLGAEAVDDASCAHLEVALRSKYRQYEGAEFDALVTLRIDSLTGWSAEG